MKLENYEVHLPNYSIGDAIYDKIGPVCESYGKTVLVIGGKRALDAALIRSKRRSTRRIWRLLEKNLWERRTYQTVEKASPDVGFIRKADMVILE